MTRWFGKQIDCIPAVAMAWSSCPAFAINEMRLVVIPLPEIRLRNETKTDNTSLTISDAGHGQT